MEANENEFIDEFFQGLATKCYQKAVGCDEFKLIEDSLIERFNLHADDKLLIVGSHLSNTVTKFSSGIDVCVRMKYSCYIEDASEYLLNVQKTYFPDTVIQKWSFALYDNNAVKSHRINIIPVICCETENQYKMANSLLDEWIKISIGNVVEMDTRRRDFLRIIKTWCGLIELDISSYELETIVRSIPDFEVSWPFLFKFFIDRSIDFFKTESDENEKSTSKIYHDNIDLRRTYLLKFFEQIGGYANQTFFIAKMAQYQCNSETANDAVEIYKKIFKPLL